MLKIKFNMLAAGIVLLLAACSKNDVNNPGNTDNDQLYNNGFFVITEGFYGRNAGTVHYYAYNSDSLATRVYEKENPGKIASNATFSSTLQFATLYNKKLYLLSKLNGPIIKLDATTLKEEARYNQETSNWRSFIGITETEGLVSTNDGVYAIDLNTLSIKNKLAAIPAVNSGDMLKSGDYIYVLQSNGAKIINSKNYAYSKGFSNITRGFVQTPNGKIWCATASRLIAINNNLDTAGISLAATIGSFGLDTPTKLTASTKENAVFYDNGNKIYKYIDGDATSLAQPFITINVSPFMIYGAIRYDANKNYLVVNGIAGYGAAAGSNYLLLYDASTGALVKNIHYGNDGSTVDYNQIYFPTLSVFQ